MTDPRRRMIWPWCEPPASTRARALGSNDDSLIQEGETDRQALTRMRLALDVRSIHDGRRVVAGEALARLKAAIVRLQAIVKG